MTATETTTGSGSRRKLFVGGGVALLVLAAAAVWFLFLRDDAPDEFSLDDATASLDDDGTGDDAGDGDSAPVDIAGTWAVDGGAGDVSAGFRVDEELSSLGEITAVGRTSGVEGTLTIDGTAVTATEITVDMTGLATDDSRRDGRMRSALDTSNHPTATFVLSEPIDLGSLPAEGETISVTANGDLTIKGVTNPVAVELEARQVGNTLVVVGSTPVVFADYGVDTPSAAIVVSLDDNGIIEWQLFFSKT